MGNWKRASDFYAWQTFVGAASFWGLIQTPVCSTKKVRARSARGWEVHVWRRRQTWHFGGGASGASDCNSKSDRSFRSRTAKDNQKSIVLATELKRNDQTIIVPLHLSVMEDGEVWFLNKIPTAYEKKSFDLWIEEGLLLGYDAEKGPLIVPSNHRSNSRRSVGVGDQVTPPNGTKKSSSPKPAVYRNQTSVGDIYQNAGPLGANDHPRADERVVISLGVSIQEAP